MHERVVRSPHFGQRHNLCPGKNVVRLVRHWHGIVAGCRGECESGERHPATNENYSRPG
jgi:hypothetical protein